NSETCSHNEPPRTILSPERVAHLGKRRGKAHAATSDRAVIVHGDPARGETGSAIPHPGVPEPPPRDELLTARGVEVREDLISRNQCHRRRRNRKRVSFCGESEEEPYCISREGGAAIGEASVLVSVRRERSKNRSNPRRRGDNNPALSAP